MADSTRKRLIGLTLSGLVLLSIAQNIYYNFQERGHAWQVLAAASGRSTPLGANCLAIDQLFEQSPSDGNICLTFTGFGSADETSLEMPYFRSSYRLYPRKVFVAPPGTVINRGRDILSAKFAPTQEWLVQNRVSFLIQFDRDPAGNITFRQFTISQ